MNVRRLRGVLLLACLSLVACGSEDDNSESKSDSGSDGGAFDGTTPDTTSGDTRVDSGAIDTAIADTGAVDSAITDTAAADSGVDARPDAIVDAAVDADAAAEADADAVAEADAPAPAAKMFAGGVTGGNIPFAAAFGAGTWTSASIGADIFSAGGGGVTVTGGGTGLVMFRGNASSDVSYSIFSAGSWSALATEGSAKNVISVPVTTSAGAYVAFHGGTTPFDTRFAEYHDVGSTWSTVSESTGAANDNNSAPSVVVTASGDPLVLLASSGSTYNWTLRTGTTWSTSAAITGSAKPTFSPRPAIVGVRRAGTSQIVAVMSGSASGKIDYSVFSAGTWSATTSVVTDGNTNQMRCWSVAALPDGRIALAYVDSAAGAAMKLGFFDGATWGTFTAVPGSGNSSSRIPIAIARGADASAVVELAYTDGASATLAFQHVRLTNETSWTWSAPVTVAPGAFDTVYLAVGP